MIVFSIVFVFIGVSALIILGFNLTNKKIHTVPETEDLKKGEVSEIEKTPEKEEIPVNERINVAVFGADKGGLRTDVIFVVSFDTATKKISMVSVPRDTKVVMTDEMLDDLVSRDRKGYIPTKTGVRGECKINEVHAYAGDGYRNQFSVMQLEDLLGIKINHFVKVDTDGFKDIVDSIGGIDMEVQERLYYNDPEQGLYIDLKPGFQHLDGDKAEQLVRFREDYAQKDLKRIQVQQDFMREFIKKVTSTDVIISNITNLIQVAFKYVETDFTLVDALKYSKYIGDIRMENVTMETIPGEGRSYFTIDKEGTKELVDRVFYGKVVETPISENSNSESNFEIDGTTSNNSKELKIEVANGGITKGMAGKQKKLLEDAGYNIVAVSTFNGEQKDFTRIIVSSDGQGEDLKKYYPNSKIEVNPKLITNGTDIKVIIGLEVK